MMPRSEPFEEHSKRYNRWFEELRARVRVGTGIAQAHAAGPRGVSVGVGTGRFAEPLCVRVGVDPSVKMLRRARRRGVETVRGVAEALPFDDGAFDTALLVTTVWFVDDLSKTFDEARRVLREGYLRLDRRIRRRVRDAGFRATEHAQTVFRMPEEMEDPDEVEEGYGEGSFVAVHASA